MNPYLTKDNKPSETLQYTLDYYGVSLKKFKAMSDEQVKQMVNKFSDVLNDGRIIKGSYATGRGTKNTAMFHNAKANIKTPLMDSGSYSRYFSLDAWWENKLKELPESVRKTFPFLLVAKASKAEKNRGCEGLGKKKKYSDFGLKERVENGKATNPRTNTEASKTFNHHPTCKPLKLMSYLITLGSRKGDLILDPFLGSGTTAIAAKMLDRQYLGYEINQEYFEIAKARLAAVTTQLSLFT